MNFLLRKKTAFHDLEGCLLLEIITNSSQIHSDQLMLVNILASMAGYRSRSDEDACLIIVKLKRHAVTIAQTAIYITRRTTRDEIEHVECILSIASYPFVIFIQLKVSIKVEVRLNLDENKLIDPGLKVTICVQYLFLLNNSSIFDWINFNRIFPR